MTSATSRDRGPAKVWVLDDDSTLVSLLIRRIQARGWLSRGFESSNALEDALQHDLPHVLILDRLLHKQSGTHVLSRLRRQGHNFPILILSALGTAESRVEGLELGADDYLAKPFLWRELELRLLRLSNRDFSQSTVNQHALTYCFQQVEYIPSYQELRSQSGTKINISRGDCDLLSCLCRTPRQVVKREILFQTSSNIVHSALSRSLDVRISKLRRTLSFCQPELGLAIQTVRGVGYRLNADVTTKTILLP